MIVQTKTSSPFVKKALKARCGALPGEIATSSPSWSIVFARTAGKGVTSWKLELPQQEGASADGWMVSALHSMKNGNRPP